MENKAASADPINGATNRPKPDKGFTRPRLLRGKPSNRMDCDNGIGTATARPCPGLRGMLCGRFP